MNKFVNFSSVVDCQRFNSCCRCGDVAVVEVKIRVNVKVIKSATCIDMEGKEERGEVFHC